MLKENGTEILQQKMACVLLTLHFHPLLKLTQIQKESFTQIKSDDTMCTNVPRDWNRGNGNEAQPANEHVQEAKGASSVMMQRWQQETVRDQPFHNIGAVENVAGCGEASQRSPNNNDNWSLQYVGKGD